MQFLESVILLPTSFDHNVVVTQVTGPCDATAELPCSIYVNHSLIVTRCNMTESDNEGLCFQSFEKGHIMFIRVPTGESFGADFTCYNFVSHC